MGILGNKSPMYKTSQGCSRCPYKMIVAWCGVRLGGGRGARRGTATKGLSEPRASGRVSAWFHLAMMWEVRGHLNWMVS